jgi:type IV secretory pathway TraG/TraD family ATPase VirD4
MATRTPPTPVGNQQGTNIALAGLAGIIAVCVTVFVALRCSMFLSGHHSSAGVVDTVSAWLHSPGQPPGTSPFMFYPVLVLFVVLAGLLVTLFCIYCLPYLRSNGVSSGKGNDGMATGKQLQPLRVRHPEGGRITLGRVNGNLVAALREHSVLVAGATRSGKTSSLAIPVLLEWTGPAVVCSTKTDLFGNTYAHRASCGPVWVFDPTRAADPDGRNGLVTHSWNPLAYCGTMTGAQKVAAAFTDASPTVKATGSTAYWKSQADQLLAAAMFAARLGGLNMGHVLTWFKRLTQPEDIGGQFADAMAILKEHRELGNPEARAAEDSLIYILWMDPKQRDSAAGTCRACLDVYDDPNVVAASTICTINPAEFLDGQQRTLYLVASRQEQARLAPLFTALLTFLDRELTVRAERNRAKDKRNRMPIQNENERVLFVLDEVAKLAPMERLPDIASEIGGEGGALLTIVQDFAQLRARYRDEWTSLVNNHPVRIALAGIADPETQRWFSGNAGRVVLYDESRSRTSTGSTTTSVNPRREKVMEEGAVRLLPDLTGLVIALNMLPFIIELRPWWKDRYLSKLVQPMVMDTTQPDDYEAPAEPPTAQPVLVADVPSGRQLKSSKSAQRETVVDKTCACGHRGGQHGGDTHRGKCGDCQCKRFTLPKPQSQQVLPAAGELPSVDQLRAAVEAGAAQRVGRSERAPVYLGGKFYMEHEDGGVEEVTNEAQIKSLQLGVARMEQARVAQAAADGLVERLGEDASMPFKFEGNWYVPGEQGPMPVTDSKQLQTMEDGLVRWKRAQHAVEQEQQSD